MANLPWRVSVRLMALAKKIAMVIGIIVLVLLSVRVYLSQQGPALHHWHTWRADEMSVQEMDNATFAAYVARENAIFTALDAEVTAKVTPRRAHAAEPLLPPEPGVARTLFPGCKPVVRADACRKAARGGWYCCTV